MGVHQRKKPKTDLNGCAKSLIIIIMAKYLKLSKLKSIFAPSLALEANSGLKYQDEGPHKRVDSP